MADEATNPVEGGEATAREYLDPPDYKKGAKPSNVWKYLKRFAPASKEGKNVECICEVTGEDGVTRPCGRLLTWQGSKMGTTNLLSHLKMHKKEYVECMSESSHSKMSNVNAMSLEDKNPVLDDGLATDDDDMPHDGMNTPPVNGTHDGTRTHRGGRGGGGRDIKRASWRQRRDADELDEDIDEFVTMSQLQHQQPMFPAEAADDVQNPSRGWTTRRRGKVINDPVHGHMYFPGVIVDAIDTPQVQRLRELKQLGTSYYVFPGASHNRFEHSLGTAHLATNMFDALRTRASSDIRGALTGADRVAVQLAGLCHDLGHGPFSHVFDNEFLPRRVAGWHAGDEPPWNHEAMGADMFRWMVDDNGMDLDKGVIDRVCDLITSSNVESATPGTKFLWDIVANKRNSIDVDKFEYLLRDQHSTGVKGNVDVGRLMSFMKVIDDQICFKASEVYNVYDLFHTRANMHQKVYTHKKAKAIEYMIVDALVEADVAWDSEISKSIWDVNEFIRLDDTILKRIEWSKESKLQKGRDLVRKIRRRELYQYVNDFAVPEEDIIGFKPVKEVDITSCQGDNNIPGGLRPDDIIVQNVKIDYSMKSKNPVDSVKFFQDYGDTRSFHIDKSKVSLLLPNSFIERKVRVFSKSKDPMYVEAAAKAFGNYQRRMYKQELQLTPMRKRARSSQDER
jgi:HD superfamily phosphohydrolase|tara:strand:- start:3474 stop:5507 length:2034 start_codon:yes stop_codon:yes gene_type:complete